MRLKRGDKVEVLNKKESITSWRVAEILSGNCHTYSVQYDHCPGIADQQVETVSMKSVRPSPPPVQDVEDFIVGDVVEVFYGYSWNIAVILKVLECTKGTKIKKVPPRNTTGQKQYLLRLIGCSQSRELVVLGSNIRTRQTWQDGKWILIGKGSQGGGDIMASRRSTSKFYPNTIAQTRDFNTKAKRQRKNDSVDIQDQTVIRQSHIIPSRSLKRKSPYVVSSVIDANNGHVRKLRAIEKDGGKKRESMPLKVDAVAYPREVLGKKNMHTSFKAVSAGYNQMERTNLSDVFGYSRVRNSENDSNSDACSVGSCSVTDQTPNSFYSSSIPKRRPHANTLSSDAQSCNGSGSEGRTSSVPPKEEVEVSIHRLELNAYRRTLEALYASGPLSWEQEALLTNLRIMLNISNDEHLMELKHLISAEKPVGIR